MRFVLVASVCLILLLGWGCALAQTTDLSNGVFIAHAPASLQYTNSPPTGTWCGAYAEYAAIDSCSEQINEVDTQGAVVWYVLSAWTESKQWCGAQFGLGDYDPDNFAIWEHGACFPSGGLTIPTSGWPGPNEGIALATTSEDWSGNFVPVYWFAGYAYGEDVIPLGPDPSSDFAGWARCEDHVEVAADTLGGLGLLTDGIYVCPQELQDSSGGSIEDEAQLDGMDGYEESELEGDGLEPGGTVWIDLGDSEGDDGDPLDIELVSSNSAGIELDMTLRGFYATPDTIDSKVYYHISVGYEPVRQDVGAPELLFFPRSVVIPDDQRMTFTILDSAFVDLANMPIAPSKGPLPMGIDPDSVPYQFGPCYESDSLYPSRALDLGRPYILRDFRGMTVCFDAFQARPASDSLRVFTHLTVVIEPDGADTVNVITRNSLPEELDSDFANLYERHFMNYSSTLDDRGHPRLVPGTLLIIVSDDSGNGWDFREDMDALVQWKRQRGQQTILKPVREICDPPTATAIREYIGSMHSGESHVSHVLLVGDSPQIPSYIEPEYRPDIDLPRWPAAVADPTYTLVHGDDIFPDVLVGRFSANTSEQVQTQVQRTITYERDLGRQGAQPWLGKVFGLATNYRMRPPGAPNSNVQWMEARMDELEQRGYTERHAYERARYDHSDGDADYLSWALNNGDEGVGVLLASNHGEPRGWGLEFPWPDGFKVDDVYDVHGLAGLTNWNRLPIIDAHSCDLGNFAYTGEDGVCFAEAWMWQKQVGSNWPGGAIATYMASRELHAQGPQWAQRETVGILSGELGRVSLGWALYGGVLSLIDWFGPTTEAARANFIVWTVFGDPSLSVRTAAPTTMTVSHSGYFHSQSEQYVVWVRDGGGAPLAGAWAAVYADESNSGVENGVLCGTGITGDDGRVAIALDQVPNEATSLVLTVTARDRVTYCDTIVEGLPSATEAEPGSVPGYELGPVWPTPATGAVYVKYSLGPDGGKGRVALSIYDVAGRRVRTLMDKAEDPGTHMLVWDGRDEAGNALHAGTYFCRMIAGGRTLAQRVVVLD